MKRAALRASPEAALPGTALPRTALLGAILLAGAACHPTAEGPTDAGALEDAAFTFGVMGDLPYTDASEARFPEVVASLEAEAPAFVIHVGDLKDGSTACTDSLLATRARSLQAIDLPLIYLPGDNEWTDCHRADEATDPLERLDALRALFYPEPASSTVGGVAWALERQGAGAGKAGLPEHQRWMHGEILFLTAHLVGSRNGLAGFPGRTEGHDRAVEERTEAAGLWLEEGFAEARDRGARAVVVAIHGNPFLEPLGSQLTGTPSGFADFLQRLVAEARRWGEPVLLVHGDTHTFRVDRPLEAADGTPVPNVLRLETYGDPALGWVEVGVRPDAPGDSVFAIAGRALP